MHHYFAFAINALARPSIPANRPRKLFPFLNYPQAFYTYSKFLLLIRPVLLQRLTRAAASVGCRERIKGVQIHTSTYPRPQVSDSIRLKLSLAALQQYPGGTTTIRKGQTPQTRFVCTRTPNWIQRSDGIGTGPGSSRPLHSRPPQLCA